MEIAVASWDTLDTLPQHPAVRIPKADDQWWVVHWAHGVLMAAQAYTPEVDLEDPPRGTQRLLKATTLTGREGAPCKALYMALYWAQGSANGADTPEPTEAWVKQAEAMRDYNLHHPFDDSPPALRWPTDPPETVQKLAHLTRNRTKATMRTPAEPPLRDPGQQATHPFFQPHDPPVPPPPVPPKRAGQRRGAPAPSPQQARRDGRAATSKPPASPTTLPTSSASAPLDPPLRRPDQASSSSSLLPHALPQPKAYSQYHKGMKFQQPFRNDHTGDWIWCEGTIQYRLQDPGPNSGVKIRVTWHRQKELDKGSRVPDKPLGDTLELNSAHSIRGVTPENKAHRGTKYNGELPPESSQGLPPPCLPKRPPPSKRSPGPNHPPRRGKCQERGPPQTRPAPMEATVNLLDLNHPAITCSKDATSALRELPMAQGTECIPHLLTFQEQGLQRDDPPEPTPIYTPDEKAYKCYWHKGTPLYAWAVINVHLVNHLSIAGRLSVYEVVGDGWQLNVINVYVPFGDATELFLQALAEAYRQMAMLAPTIIIGDMNAPHTPADQGGQATPRDHAVRDIIQMLGLPDLTANLEGQPSHFSHPTEAAPSRINICCGDTTTISRAEARYGPLLLGPTGQRPLQIRLTIPNFPPSPREDAGQGLPPSLKCPHCMEKHFWSQYHRAIDCAWRNQGDPQDLLTAMHTAAVACGFQQ